MKLTLLNTDSSNDLKLFNSGLVFHLQFDMVCRQEVSGLLSRYSQNVLVACILKNHLIGQLYNQRPFCSCTSVDHLQLGCNVEYANPNQWIMCESHNIQGTFQYAGEKDFDKSFP
jgi:hypothetical protein